MKTFLKYWLPVIVYAAVIFYFSSIPSVRLPKNLFFPDYILHFLEYLPFGFLVLRAVKATKSGLSLRKIFISSVFLVVLYAVSDEFHQSFVPGRFASFLDLFCDSLGGVIGAKIAL